MDKNKLNLLVFIMIWMYSFTITEIYADYEKKYIAVMKLTANDISEIEIAVITNRLRSELFKSGKYTVVEREMMDKVMQEQGFQQTGCTSDECAVEFGKILGVEQMLVGSISRIGKLLMSQIRIIDVESGEILKMSDYNFKGEIEDFILDGLSKITKEIVGDRVVSDLMGKITFESKNPYIVFIDGKEIDESPFYDYLISAGTHKIVIKNLEMKVLEEEIIFIEGNKDFTFNIKPSRIKFNLGFEAYIYVDDKLLSKSESDQKKYFEGSHKVKIIEIKTGIIAIDEQINLATGKVREFVIDPYYINFNIDFPVDIYVNNKIIESKNYRKYTVFKKTNHIKIVDKKYGLIIKNEDMGVLKDGKTLIIEVDKPKLWSIDTKLGISTSTGILGLGYTNRNFSISSGFFLTGDFGIFFSGIRYNLERLINKNTWFAGFNYSFFSGELSTNDNHTIYQNNYRFKYNFKDYGELYGLMFGYNWRWASGFNATFALGAGLYNSKSSETYDLSSLPEELQTDPQVLDDYRDKDKSDSVFIPLLELTIGYNF